MRNLPFLVGFVFLINELITFVNQPKSLTLLVQKIYRDYECTYRRQDRRNRQNCVATW